MLMDTEDCRLTRPERQALRVIAIRLQGGVRIRRPDIKLFGDCDEDGDLEMSCSVMPPQW